MLWLLAFVPEIFAAAWLAASGRRSTATPVAGSDRDQRRRSSRPCGDQRSVTSAAAKG
jgi:hypothetical protein